jgi:hypothetical protein
MKIEYDPKLGDGMWIYPDIGERWFKPWDEHFRECKIVAELVEEALLRAIWAQQGGDGGSASIL